MSQSSPSIWGFNHQAPRISKGPLLRVEVMATAIVRWTADDWKTATDSKTTDAGLGVHHVDLPTTSLGAGTPITFTFFWETASRWEGKDFQVTVENAAGRTQEGEPL